MVIERLGRQASLMIPKNKSHIEVIDNSQRKQFDETIYLAENSVIPLESYEIEDEPILPRERIEVPELDPEPIVEPDPVLAAQVVSEPEPVVQEVVSAEPVKMLEPEVVSVHVQEPPLIEEEPAPAGVTEPAYETIVEKEPEVRHVEIATIKTTPSVDDELTADQEVIAELDSGPETERDNTIVVADVPVQEEPAVEISPAIDNKPVIEPREVATANQGEVVAEKAKERTVEVVAVGMYPGNPSAASGGLLAILEANRFIFELALIVMAFIAGFYALSAHRMRHATAGVAASATSELRTEFNTMDNMTITSTDLYAQLEQASEQDSLKSDFSGSIDTMSLIAVTQLLNSESETGILRISGKNSKDGDLFFEDGEIVHAVIEDKTGPDAVYDIMKKRKGTFAFIRGQHEDLERTVNQGTISPPSQYP